MKISLEEASKVLELFELQIYCKLKLHEYDLNNKTISIDNKKDNEYIDFERYFQRLSEKLKLSLTITIFNKYDSVNTHIYENGLLQSVELKNSMKCYSKSIKYTRAYNSDGFLIKIIKQQFNHDEIIISEIIYDKNNKIQTARLNEENIKYIYDENNNLVNIISNEEENLDHITVS